MKYKLLSNGWIRNNDTHKTGDEIEENKLPKTISNGKKVIDWELLKKSGVELEKVESKTRLRDE